MEYINQPPTGANAGPDTGAQQPGQPQAGGYYQFQPGVGFVPAQGQPQQGAAGADQAMGGQPYAGSPGAAQQAAQGLYGQGMPEGAQPKFDQNKLGQMYGVMTDVMNGEAEPSQLLGLFAGTGGEFWKGALVGAAAVVLLNNETVKGALSGLAASAGSLLGERDPEGEQVTVGDK